MVVVDGEGRILQSNPTLEKLTGFRADQIEGRFFWEVFVPPDQIELIRGLFKNALKEQKPIQFEHHLLDRQGEKRRVCWALKHLDKGNQPKILLCGLDQTEVLQLKDELRQIYRRSQQTSQLLQELCSAVQTNPGSVSPQLLAALQELAKPMQSSGHPFHPLRAPMPEEQRQFVRRVYQYRQKVAPYTEGRFPKPEQFFSVQCKDISAGGIGFFMDKEPSFQHLVVALGEGPASSYFLAEVVRWTPVDHQGKKVYLIGCKFCGRITPPADFKLPPSSQ